MFYLISPGIGCLLGLILLVWLAGAALRSAGGKMLETSGPVDPETWKEYKKQAGPMTLKERVATAVIVVVFLAIVIGIAHFS